MVFVAGVAVNPLWIVSVQVDGDDVVVTTVLGQELRETHDPLVPWGSGPDEHASAIRSAVDLALGAHSSLVSPVT